MQKTVTLNKPFIEFHFFKIIFWGGFLQRNEPICIPLLSKSEHTLVRMQEHFVTLDKKRVRFRPFHNFCYWKINVWVKKTETNCSSDTLLWFVSVFFLTQTLRWFHCQGCLRNQLIKLRNEWLLAEIECVTRLELNTFQFRRVHAAGKLVIAIEFVGLLIKHELYYFFHFGLPAQSIAMSIAFCLEIVTGISATERLRWFHCQGYLRNQLIKLKNEWLFAEIEGVTRLKLNTFQFRREHAAGKLVIAIEFVTLCLLAMKKVLPVDSFTKSEDLNVEIQTQFKCT